MTELSDREQEALSSLSLSVMECCLHLYCSPFQLAPYLGLAFETPVHIESNPRFCAEDMYRLAVIMALARTQLDVDRLRRWNCLHGNSIVEAARAGEVWCIAEHNLLVKFHRTSDFKEVLAAGTKYIVDVATIVDNMRAALVDYALRLR